MKITLFTTNQARHITLIELLSEIADEVHVIVHGNTIFPGQNQGYYGTSDVMNKYFGHLIRAERHVFGLPRFTPKNVQIFSVLAQDVNDIPLEWYGPALTSDAYVVFGAPYIKGHLIDFLIEHRAYNIHMGTSPWYRGSSCNFWAMYDEKPEFVGATIHLLSRGLDSGAILFHALPDAAAVEPFELGMLAVKAAHKGLVAALSNGSIHEMKGIIQDRSYEIRYTKSVDFTDSIANEYMTRMPTSHEIKNSLSKRDLSLFCQPFIG